MLFHSYVPRPPLSDFVDRFWLCDDAQSHRKEEPCSRDVLPRCAASSRLEDS
jgi:hypothetical protein